MTRKTLATTGVVTDVTDLGSFRETSPNTREVREFSETRLESVTSVTRDAGTRLALDVFPGAIVLACPACGGTSWRPDGPDGERCMVCGAWSPVSVVRREDR
jgi:hypothetical protein